MSAFQFRLQPVYDLRTQLEKEQKDVFARQTQKLNGLLEDGRCLENEYTTWSKKYIRAAGEGIGAAQALRILNYLDELRQRIRENRRHTHEQEQAVERERLSLVEKMKDRKVIETLRDKRYRKFLEEEQKKQEKEVEEIIGSRLR